ncbi:hypothetical protein [Streptomyces sp. CFMR 7]|uniref:hypothetical protein n=1 Tax=Streptomyces sp. CFMR 7 TaxID=1649184 RepID=UPI0011A49BB7|nr:hypothetical protein [Streptomyces sp. CFMR 7]
MSKSGAELYEDLRAAVQALDDAGENVLSSLTRFADGSRGLSGKTGSLRLPQGGTEWKVVYPDEQR